ncbi:carbohydrate ABC transporter permease [Leifsonia poae]|uniref:carbohydrate ABC transporter permease n=1 Tax=Leifsonia poae TaxID=110933 RepID=UPI001CBC809F|nr:carbohydrate ABC transporter permease [Leifsonia poae]
MVAGAIVFLFPFVWMISTSLTAPGNLFRTPPQLIPQPFDVSGYVQLFENEPMLRWMLNSILVSGVLTVIQVTTSALAAYGFTRLEFPGRNALFVLVLATLMVPFQVLIVPLFVEFKSMNLLDTYAALILPDIAMPFGIFLLRQAFLQLPREIEEAAFVDGAGHIRVFFSIVVPMSKPILATVAIFSFMGAWNSFLWPLIAIHSTDMMTLPLGLSNMSGVYDKNWNMVLAGAAVSVVPVIAVFLFAQRYVLQGVSMSGLKG